MLVASRHGNQKSLTSSRFLGIRGTPWDHPVGRSSISRGMGGLEKRGGFLILSCIHYYIENFQELNLGKVLFLLQPPKIYCPCFVESNKFF